jgi:hypothetical protein
MKVTDTAAWERQTLFNQGFKPLLGSEWTAFHVSPKGPNPPKYLQAAFPWRRDVFYAHFMARRAVGNAFQRYDSSECSDWSSAQRELERLMHVCAALAFHNAFADRIAQLANATGEDCPRPRKDENDVSFVKFVKDRPFLLPLTWVEAKNVEAHTDFRTTRKLGNAIKHRWTGELISHQCSPDEIRAMFKEEKGTTYMCFGALKKVLPEDIDEKCLMIQRSLNLLVELAQMLDKEIGWARHFKFAGQD